MRFHRRARQAIIAAATATLLVAGTVLAAAPASAAPPLPSKVAALGDSITQASMTCSALVNCPTNSWSTGTTSSVGSHLLKLRALQPGVTMTAYNNSVAGAVASALPGQATAAVNQQAGYVTIEIGANDACASTVGGMTSVDSFRSSVTTAITTLANSSGKPEIFVASIPNIKRLWELNKGSLSARLAWAILGNCKSMLAKPTSTAAADVQRRDAVQARVDAYNAVLADVCKPTLKCRWDGGAVASYQFSKADISTRDYFHPSLSGQATLARITWAKTQWVG